MALPRSSLFSMSEMTKDWRHGMSNALIRPCRTFSAISAGIVMRPANTSAASAKDWSIERIWVPISRRCWFTRSTTMPASGVRRTEGSWPAKPTRPSILAEPVRR